MAGDLGLWECNTNSYFPGRRVIDETVGVSIEMLFLAGTDVAEDRLVTRGFDCPGACDGQLGPWGWARPRPVRVGGEAVEWYRPRRARCGACGVTHVICDGRVFPRRRDCITTVTKALLLAVNNDGLGFRPIAEIVGVPASTVRDWLTRARVNADRSWVLANQWLLRLDPNAEPVSKYRSGIPAALDQMARTARAAVLRFGPVANPWRYMVQLTSGALLTPPSFQYSYVF